MVTMSGPRPGLTCLYTYSALSLPGPPTQDQIAENSDQTSHRRGMFHGDHLVLDIGTFIQNVTFIDMWKHSGRLWDQNKHASSFFIFFIFFHLFPTDCIELW